MKQVVQNLKTGELDILDVPPPQLRSGGVIVRNVYSSISVGTERATVLTAKSNIFGKARSRPDLVKQTLANFRNEGLAQTYKKVSQRLNMPKALGYSSAGIVTEVGDCVEGFNIGDKVACAGDFANHAELVFIHQNLCVRVPDNVELDQAAITTIGAIAIQGIRQANVSVGDNVAVIGLGLLGLLTVQILKASGAQVIGIDIEYEKTKLAETVGADYVVQIEGDDPVGMVMTMTQGFGVDSVIITAATHSNQPIELAGEIARDRGTVVLVGAVKADIPRSPYYEKELEVKLSRSYGPGRYDYKYEENGVDYPIGYVRWTENRNMQAFLKLLSERRIDLRSLITHKFAIENAVDAYEMITNKDNRDYIAVLIEYPQSSNKESTINIREDNNSERSSITIGFIGAGSFAQSYLIPNLKNIDNVSLKRVATATGINAQNVAKKFGFESCTTNHMDVLDDSEINCVFIATRHNLHAQLVAEALKRNKSVFVEKPLALTKDELQAIVDAYETTRQVVVVGFNRRFAPIAKEAKSVFRGRTEPMVVNYRINAGFIPKTHWIQDPIEGGGRIIGEVCHFIDLIQYFTDSAPEQIFAESIVSQNKVLKDEDNINITIKMTDGSLGVITYLANGDSSLAKERIEVFSKNQTIIIDDFKKLMVYKNGKSRRIKGIAGGKGHKEEIQSYVESILHGKPPSIGFNEIIATTLTTFGILESLKTGKAVTL